MSFGGPAGRERTALFAYGSLVSAESVATTLGRPPRPVRRATLRGWRRSFTLLRDNRRSEKTFARVDDGSIPDWILSLNLERGEGGPPPNGALIEVDETELARLDLREIRYARCEVTSTVESPGGSVPFARVVTYVARPECFAPGPPAGAVILRAYVEAVEAAFAILGPEELDAFRGSTPVPPVEVIEGELVRDEIPAGNPRAW